MRAARVGAFIAAELFGQEEAVGGREIAPRAAIGRSTGEADAAAAETRELR